MEETQECSHDYMQQEEGQTAVKTDRNTRKTVLGGINSEKEKDEGSKDPTGDRNLYYKYYKQNGHDTEECSNLLGFVEQGLKKGKFREYTRRYKQRDDDRRVRQRMNNPENKTNKKRDEPKDHGTHREIAIILEGIPEQENPPSKKAVKRSRHSCLAVEVMPRTLEGKPPQR
ncbi:hypothetical protein PIB30_049415 [Stylosanthes scabra]|uniref:Uncharacterized protein n=1 Tax=Stylosanthes scabra TaxID=79078 RepID=A0ABU6QHY7_9FABA|nr:hypothetical protein [Stylosanthes scabra]